MDAVLAIEVEIEGRMTVMSITPSGQLSASHARRVRSTHFENSSLSRTLTSFSSVCSKAVIVSA